jgi:hypothetical protein
MENIRNFSYDEIETHFLKIGEKNFVQNKFGNGYGKNMPPALRI